MIPSDTYMYLCCMSSCVFWPLLCVTEGVRQAYQHRSNKYWEATPAPPIILFFGNQSKDNYIKMPPLICHYFFDSFSNVLG